MSASARKFDNIDHLHFEQAPAEKWLMLAHYYTDKVFGLIGPDRSMVLLMIHRFTVGYQKRWARLSLKQISEGVIGKTGEKVHEGTGLSESTVRRCLNDLLKVNLIVRRERYASNGLQLPCEWALNVAQQDEYIEDPEPENRGCQRDTLDKKAGASVACMGYHADTPGCHADTPSKGFPADTPPCHADTPNKESVVKETLAKKKAEDRESVRPRSRKNGAAVSQTDPLWQEFVAAYPARNGDRGLAKGRLIFDRLVASGTDSAALLEGVRRYRAWCDATGRSGTDYVKQIPTFLNGRFWEEEYELPTVTVPVVRKNGQHGGRETMQQADERLAREYAMKFGGVQ